MTGDGHDTAPLQHAAGRRRGGDGSGVGLRSGGLDGLGSGLRPLATTLLRLPRRDLALDVHADVGRASNALLGAQLAVGVPRLVVETDHAAGVSLRRHVHSVADRSVVSRWLDTHWLAINYPVTGHLEVRLKHAGRVIDNPSRPP